MKKILVLIILAVLTLAIAGCGPMTPQDRMAISEAFRNWPQVEQRQRESGQTWFIGPPISPNRQSYYPPTYWQEKNAEREYYEKLRTPPKIISPKLTYP